MKRYAWITLLIVAITIVLHPFSAAFDLVNMALIYLIPVLLSAVYGGTARALYAAFLGFLAFDFFFVPPFLSFTVADLRYLITFAVFLAVAGLTGSLSARLQQQLQISKQREAHVSSLYALSRRMSAIAELPALLDSVTQQVARLVKATTVVYLPDERRELRVAAVTPSDSTGEPNESERTIARWVFQQGETAGKSSSHLREMPGYYVPLRTESQVYGVLAVRLEPPHDVLTADTRDLLEALGGLAAIAIARLQLTEEAKIAHLTAESEKLRTALLDSVSHELRTPLAAIIGSATGLIEGDQAFSSQDRLELLAAIRDGALRMNRLVTNLLGMVKLESGMLRLRKTWCDLEDILGVVLAQVHDHQQHRHIRVRLPEAVPPLLCDEVLMEQVLVNLTSNAIKYSPDYSEILLAAEIRGNRLLISVTDSGIGLAEEDRERIFEKFYRAKAAGPIPGTGLGLAISKGIVELHGGTLSAEPNGERGTIMTVSLPMAEERRPEPALREEEWG